MYRLCSYILLSFAFPFAAISSIDFLEMNLEEAQQYAAAQDKLIFIDTYATWCGPCKKLIWMVPVGHTC